MGKRFEVKLKENVGGGIIKIVADTETGVNYLITSGLGLSGMTPLLDKDGKVVID
ncbi:DUF6440 family protein [Sporosarcina sp. ZBG7A]|uniref:DUF6440 family protein n=1 Tax=Sporosarcina sp. ZBG7A TaxID=1582223 RepID=UPI000AF33545|nr:DUF6440 family protein [Sporosarcina sp. ZBG7A]